LNRFKQVLLEDDGDDSDNSNKEHYPPFTMPNKMTNFKWVLGASRYKITKCNSHSLSWGTLFLTLMLASHLYGVNLVQSLDEHN